MLAMQGLVGAIGANSLLYDLTVSMHYGEYASCHLAKVFGHLWFSSNTIPIWISWVGSLVLGTLGLEAAMSSRPS